MFWQDPAPGKITYAKKVGSVLLSSTGCVCVFVPQVRDKNLARLQLAIQEHPEKFALFTFPEKLESTNLPRS